MAATSADPLERLEAVLALGRSAPSRRMLIIVNPYATTVSDRLKNLVVYALRGRYEVDAIDTNARGHATELSREAAREGYDVVVAFGGDGTVNEAANGLVGSDTPLCCLPGRSRERVLPDAGDPDRRGRRDRASAADGRRLAPAARGPRLGERSDFLFSAGVGLDASVVERVDAHPRLKAGSASGTTRWVGLRTFTRRYLLYPPRLEAQLGEETIAGVTVIVQNAAPYTYFGNRPVEMGEGATLHSGDLAGVVLDRARPIDVPTILARALSRHLRVSRHRHVHPFSAVTGLRVCTRDDRPLPIQVDGDYIGEADEAVFGVRPNGISVVS